VKGFFDMEIIGETTDDAVGEAFDKSAKILGLPYPGGPLIDKLAQEGNPKRFTFTKPRVPALNFSFSGLKTQILYFVQKSVAENPNFIEENKTDICASIQHTIIEILMDKMQLAVAETGIKQIAIGGGTTDTAAMIGIVGYQKFLEKKFNDTAVISKARMEF
jgi:N6-L-threonylcarbamoyladenine synthase